MSYQVLARRWRPLKFEDVVGQDHIIRSLQNSLALDRVGHAYIFAGTRGIGKTSIARIFAKALRCITRLENGDSCGVCDSCKNFNTSTSMDVLEIDGASNNSVDDVRDLIGNIQYLPTSGKYKVYIIDEVHMLSTSAFNALLKTLEEPPAHAIFILATTEPDKLLGTVLSRCQRFDFRNASVPDLVIHLKKIAKEEGITFEKESLISELSKLGSGSFRDTLSLLDQVLSFSRDKNITEDVFARSLGVAKVGAIKALISGMIRGDAQLISSTYRTIISENVTVKNIVKSVLESLFAIISSKDFGDYKRVADRIEEAQFNEIPRAELYWMYEVLAQDFSWTLESIAPEDTTELALRKVALRNDLVAEIQGGGPGTVGKSLASKSAPVEQIQEVQESAAPIIESIEEEKEPKRIEQIEEAEEAEEAEVVMPEMPAHMHEEIPPIVEFAEPIKKIEIIIPLAKDLEVQKEEVVQEVEAPTNEEEPTFKGERTWESFLDHLSINSPASSANLEQGNLLSPISCSSDSVTIALGFPQSAKVFFDYLDEPESYEKLKEGLSQYFKVKLEDVSLTLELVEREVAAKSNFKSKFEIKVDIEEKENVKKYDEIEGDLLIKHAEEIFGSKVDKILLKDNE